MAESRWGRHSPLGTLQLLKGWVVAEGFEVHVAVDVHAEARALGEALQNQSHGLLMLAKKRCNPSAPKSNLHLLVCLIV